MSFKPMLCFKGVPCLSSVDREQRGRSYTDLSGHVMRVMRDTMQKRNFC